MYTSKPKNKNVFSERLKESLLYIYSLAVNNFLDTQYTKMQEFAFKILI